MSGIYDTYQPTVETYGASAWNAMRPLRPKVNLGQFFAELRDFPSMLRIKLKRFKDLGSQYLNAEFGWKPFLRDITDWYESVSKLDRTIAFARKNNGKWLMRKGTLRKTEDTVVTEQTVPVWPAMDYYFWPTGSTPKTNVRTISSDRIWYVARVKFYIPDLQWDTAESVWSSRLLRHLYGLEITPSLCWELMPWSWFHDWNFGFGNVLKNFSNDLYDNLVAKYAYVMRHRRSVRSYQLNTAILGDQECARVPSGQLGIQTVVGTECKERCEASPFGFGLMESNYTPSQIAILAALGISRVG